MEARTIIVAVPSLNLVKQTVGVWLHQEVARGRLTDWLCAASDDTVGEVDDVDDERSDIGLPTTTDVNKIADWLREPADRKIVFTTYHSSPKLAEAARLVGVEFDLIVLDEAHRIAGARDREFVTLLHHDKVKTRRRLFMTATERKIRNSNGDGDIDVLFSMDDNIEDYGARFYTMSFKEAIERRIIADYRIVTYSVKKSEVEALMLNSFEIGPSSENFHVDSALSAGERKERLDQFIQSPVAVMSNARCLTEGVDVPGIDAVVFAAPKQSTVDIVQASGRALRRAKGKEFGYIVIPIIVPDDMPFAEFAETTEFKTIIKILAALSTQDDRIVETLRARFNDPNPNGAGEPRERIIEIGGEVPIGFKIPLDEFAPTAIWMRARVTSPKTPIASTKIKGGSTQTIGWARRPRVIVIICHTLKQVRMRKQLVPRAESNGKS